MIYFHLRTFILVAISRMLIDSQKWNEKDYALGRSCSRYGNFVEGV